jgi:hypothetical protein
MLTLSSPFDLHRRDGKYRQYFNHDLDDHVRHCRGRYHFLIKLEPPKDILDACKEISEYVLARIGILDRLTDYVSLPVPRTRDCEWKLTKRRTPIPANITFAGEKTF